MNIEIIKSDIEILKDREKTNMELSDKANSNLIVIREQIANLEKQLAELEVEVYRGWLPELGEEYYWLDVFGYINHSEYQIKTSLGIYWIPSRLNAKAIFKGFDISGKYEVCVEYDKFFYLNEVAEIECSTRKEQEEIIDALHKHYNFKSII